MFNDHMAAANVYNIGAPAIIRTPIRIPTRSAHS